jgi:hypothetical protein
MAQIHTSVTLLTSRNIMCQYASHICCLTHFVRCDVRVESRHCNQFFPEMEEMLIEKLRQWTFLYDTKSPDYRNQHMRANT